MPPLNLPVKLPTRPLSSTLGQIRDVPSVATHRGSGQFPECSTPIPDGHSAAFKVSGWRTHLPVDAAR